MHVVPVQHAPVWEQTAQVCPSMNEPLRRMQELESRLVTHWPLALQQAPMPDWARASGAATRSRNIAAKVKRQQRERSSMGGNSGKRAKGMSP